MSFSLKQPVIYICRDLERALGLPLNTQGNYIISNFTPFANSLAKGRKNILLIKNKELLDTRHLIEHPSSRKFLSAFHRPNILVFKNTALIEKVCAQAGYNLLNPGAKLANLVEEKISQVEWLGKMEKFLPPHSIMPAKSVKWQNKKFILQFNRAHTGSGTILVESESQLQDIQVSFPDRPVRVTKYIEGIMLTSNNVVWENQVLVGNISAQITGLAPFTERAFATVGNDWSFARKILSKAQKERYAKMAVSIGRKLALAGWKGLFGIDVLLEVKTGKLYLIEINARQPASASYESELQLKKNKNGVTAFQAHISALLGLKNTVSKLTKITDGAQIVQKVVSLKNKKSVKKILAIIAKLRSDNFRVFVYENNEVESDWVRVQSDKGFLKNFNTLNANGEKCRDFSISILR